jgi:hypothetical protein
MRARERRSWTKEEDNMLRAAIKLEEPHADRPSKWHSIARHVPGRTNKDCRKRWCATMASVVSKGGWSSEEDRKLLEAVEKHSTKWSLVASMVDTRNSGQCAKRWNDTLNPEIDRSAWSADEDAKLLDAVNTHGTSWTTIVKSNFPGRTALAAKNRYSHLSRSTHSRRASSPSTLSSTDASEVSSPVPMDMISSSASFASSPTGNSGKADLSSSNGIDEMGPLFDDAAADSPPSSSPSPSPPSPSDFDLKGSESKTSENQILERFLNNLASDGSAPNFPESKTGEFPFSDHFLTSDAGPMIQELFSSSFDPFSSDSGSSLSNMTGLGDGSFTLDPEPVPLLWPGMKDFDMPVMDIPVSESTSGRTSPALSSDGNPSISSLNVPRGSFHPDQQVAVAVAICRADNLRPTVQILIQSLAGALAQPVAPGPSSFASNKT